MEWAWALKEHLCTLLATTSLDAAGEQMQTLRAVDEVAAMPEADLLVATLETWWPAIEILIVTGVTNARTGAANTTIENIKRTGRGFRNENNYRARVLLTTSGTTPREHPPHRPCSPRTVKSPKTFSEFGPSTTRTHHKRH